MQEKPSVDFYIPTRGHPPIDAAELQSMANEGARKRGGTHAELVESVKDDPHNQGRIEHRYRVVGRLTPDFE